MRSCYTGKFYKDLKEGSLNSALQVVPMLIALFKPESVIDVGCGIGTWLKVFSDSGVRQICGVDGEYVGQSQLLIPVTEFIPHDLTEPLKIDRKFDVAISLEVAEHLPEEKADAFVETLVSFAPVVVFSASIPFQGGTNHVNEQWQSFWARKFISKGYKPSTILREKIWHLPNILSCYKQNMIVYIDDKYRTTEIDKINIVENISSLDVVHPEIYESYANPKTLKTKALKAVISGFPSIIKSMTEDVKNIMR